MRTHLKLLHDIPAYVGSYGRIDQEHLFEALQAHGKDTVVRVGFNVTSTDIPYRMLGLVASAYYITNLYLPEARLELVATAHANSDTNHIEPQQSINAARFLFEHIASHVNLVAMRPDKVLFATDKPSQRSSIDHGAVKKALQQGAALEQLERSAANRGADYASYVAAHLLIHDTLDSVHPLDVAGHTNATLSDAEYLVSFGGQLESNFYKARMDCRAANVLIPHRVQKTGQLLAKYVVAPYLFSRQTVKDPSILDEQGAAGLFMQSTPPNNAVERDIVHANLLLGEAEITRDCFEPNDAASLCRSIQLTANDAGYWNTFLYNASTYAAPAANSIYIS